MKKMIDDAFRRFAAEVTVVRDGEERPTRGFLQPITKESGEEPFHMGVLGAADLRCWRLLAEAESDLAAEDYIIFRGECYRVMRTQAVYVGGEVSHHEAVLVKEERG